MLDARLAAGDPALTEPIGDSIGNSIGFALGVLGDEWTLLIVRGAFEGARRFGDWKSTLPISDAVLAGRLSALVDAGVLRRRPSPDTSRQDYVLTPAGLDLWQLLLCIWDWERRHVTGQSDRLPLMVHAACGSAFHPELHCARCTSTVTAADVESHFGPSGGFERSVPVGSNRRRRSVGRDSDTSAGPGLFAETMAIIGSRWSSAVLGAAFLGATRFRDFEQVGAPPSMLSDRLRRFVDLGVLHTIDPETTIGRGSSPGAYGLSAKGAAFFPVVVAFLIWGERWHPSPEGPAIESTHRSCGARFAPMLTCSACRGPVSVDTVRVVEPTAIGTALR